MEDLTTLSLARINELMVDAGITFTATAASFVQTNASDEAQYQVNYFSDTRNEDVANHVFVDFDLQDDIRLQMYDIDEGDLNLRVEVEVSQDEE